MGKCPKCGTSFDPEQFRVKVHGIGPFLSCLCKACAKADGAEIIEVAEEAKS